MEDQQQQNRRPSCFACVHFYITHEPTHPYGCRVMHFKSLQLPSVVVFNSSGMDCQLSQKKND